MSSSTAATRPGVAEASGPGTARRVLSAVLGLAALVLAVLAGVMFGSRTTSPGEVLAVWSGTTWW